jgi:hypothetical protein
LVIADVKVNQVLKPAESVHVSDSVPLQPKVSNVRRNALVRNHLLKHDIVDVLPRKVDLKNPHRVAFITLAALAEWVALITNAAVTDIVSPITVFTFTCAQPKRTAAVACKRAVFTERTIAALGAVSDNFLVTVRAVRSFSTAEHEVFSVFALAHFHAVAVTVIFAAVVTRLNYRRDTVALASVPQAFLAHIAKRDFVKVVKLFCEALAVTVVLLTENLYV